MSSETHLTGLMNDGMLIELNIFLMPLREPISASALLTRSSTSERLCLTVVTNAYGNTERPMVNKKPNELFSQHTCAGI